MQKGLSINTFRLWSGGQDSNLRHTGFCYRRLILVCLIGWVTSATIMVEVYSISAAMRMVARKLYQAELPPVARPNVNSRDY